VLADRTVARRQPKQLKKLLCYILGHRPDEFGLVPSGDGFVLVKDLLQAIKEEEGWAYVRPNDIREVLVIEPDQFELRDDRIRLNPRDLSGPLVDSRPGIIPELLYHGARQKTYPHILINGLLPARYPYVWLTSEDGLALRMARRRDPKPVLIRVHAARAHEDGILFSRVRELIYLVDSIPPAYLEGPPLPREKPPPKKPPERQPAPAPGSFELDLQSIPKRLRREKEKRVEAWKKEARRYRKDREKGRH
jgi:putative RNA 2'-phosphotransferase